MSWFPTVSYTWGSCGEVVRGQGCLGKPLGLLMCHQAHHSCLIFLGEGFYSFHFSFWVAGSPYSNGLPLCNRYYWFVPSVPFCFFCVCGVSSLLLVSPYCLEENGGWDMINFKGQSTTCEGFIPIPHLNIGASFWYLGIWPNKHHVYCSDIFWWLKVNISILSIDLIDPP